MFVEYYTPQIYIEAVRRVLGEIDLDLASSALANENIKAKKYYTDKDQSQNIDWCTNSKIFLNPPYDKQINQFADRYASTNLKEAIVLTNSCTETKWYHKFLTASDMIAFQSHRISFYDAHKKEFTKNNTKGQTFFYRGSNKLKFANEFRQLGCQICSVLS